MKRMLVRAGISPRQYDNLALTKPSRGPCHLHMGWTHMVLP